MALRFSGNVLELHTWESDGRVNFAHIFPWCENPVVPLPIEGPNLLTLPHKFGDYRK